MQEGLWKERSAFTTHSWGIKRSKLPPRHAKCRDKKHKLPLWLSLHNGPKVVWVELQLAGPNARFQHFDEAFPVLAHGSRAFATTEGQSLDIRRCRELWKNGLKTDAMDALDILVHRGWHVPCNLFNLALKRCVEDKDLASGRRIHALIVKNGWEGDAFFATRLIVLYASYGRLEEAMGVFTKVSTPDAYTWATIISAYARHGSAAKAAQAVRLYRQMCESSTVKPDDRIYSAVLKACATAGDVVAGKEVHSHVLATSREPDRFVQAGLVSMYSKCGSLEDARRLFDGLLLRDAATWNAMIAGYAQQGMGQEALRLYKIMQQEGRTFPDSVTYVGLLQACASVGEKALDQGKQLHAEIKERGLLHQSLVLSTSLVNMYAKCGSLANARSLFNKLTRRNVVAWNAMIAGYAQHGRGQEALSLYRSMQWEAFISPTSVTYVSLLQACASVGDLDEGRQLHVEIEERGLQEDLVLGRSLINMYVKCGSLNDARRLFDKLPQKTVVAWNAMIGGYAQQGMGQEAFHLYRSMQHEGLTRADSVTYVCLLQACAAMGVEALDEGKQLHAEVNERRMQGDPVVATSLVNMYAKCGSLNDARKLFGMLPERNIVAWTAMIAAYAQQGMGAEALDLYRNMQQQGRVAPDSVTYVCLLQACASLGAAALDEGKQLHAEIQKRGLQEHSVVTHSLLHMYVKCGSLQDARMLFDRLPKSSIVAWNTMITGYTQQGMVEEALSLHRSMQLEGLTPDSVTYLCLLQACAAVAALPLGQKLHAEIEGRGLQVDGVIGAALVNMYAKCGSMYDAQRVFDSLSDRSIEAWGAIATGYARQGDSQLVFDLLDRMRWEGVQPDEITCLAVLTVCSHTGLVDKGRENFKALRTTYGISATMEHFVCMLDLLGRAGHLNEALQMAKSMPFPPNGVAWRALLGACRKWKNVEIGRQAFQGAMSVDEKDDSSYVLMSGIYASAQMWEEAKEMQARRMKLGAWKNPGQSWWADQGGLVHMFVAGDKKHPESEGIYARLGLLIPRLKKEGYVPHLESASLDVPDCEREAELCGHSEKLAIAYALNKTAEGTTIRIVKNLRVCEDCHSATAFISRTEKRTIVCRDASRFHVFTEGKCSCGNYW